jgi:hypothetical protein
MESYIASSHFCLLLTYNDTTFCYEKNDVLTSVPGAIPACLASLQ